MIEITRFNDTFSFTAGATAGTTTARFSFQQMAGAGVVIGATNGATQINWYAAAGAEDTPVQIYSDGSAITTAVTVGAHPVPDACFAFPYVAPIVTGSTSCSMTIVVKG
jgi:hypothetical protein